MVYVIAGAGGHARELAFQMRLDGLQVAAFVDDLRPGEAVDGLTTITAPEALHAFPDAHWLVGIGSPRIRQRVGAELLECGVHIGTFVSSRAFVAPTASVGIGSQIFAFAVVSDACVVGSGVIIHYGSVVSHDSEIGDFSILCPRVAIAGNVRLGRRVFAGVGSSFRDGKPENKLSVGDDAMIGAGACVVSHIACGTVAVGVPARVRSN